MKYWHSKQFGRGMIASAMAVALMACSAKEQGPNTPVVEAEEPLKFGILAFGDSGYHPNYLKESQYNPPKTTEAEYLDAKQKKWIKSKRPPAEFSAPPSYYVESENTWIEASGLYPTAEAMVSYCESRSCEFSVMLGDNIYPDGATKGVDGKSDEERFDILFSKPFSPLGEGKPDFRIYTTLGNHDWNTSRAGAMAQVEFMENTLPFYMDGISYSVKPPAGNGEVEIFVIDTEVLLSSTTVYEDELNDDGSPVVGTEVKEPEPWTVPQNDAEKNMVAWLDNAMKQSDARWKLVVAHHPIWSTGGTKFTQATALREMLMPTLCRYADVYFAGHEHSLELHEDSCESVLGEGSNLPLLEIISGAAGKQRGVNTAFKAYQDKHHPETKSIWVKGMTWGFAHIQFDGDSATVDMVTTPNDGSATTETVFSHTFGRRSNRVIL